jgi:predicted ATP-dependent protease
LKPRVAAGEIRVWEKVVSLTRKRAEAKSFGRSPIGAIYAIARRRARSTNGRQALSARAGELSRLVKGAIMTPAIR